jgi:hypothetical protein
LVSILWRELEAEGRSHVVLVNQREI